MHLFASLYLLAGMLFCVGLSAWALYSIWRGHKTSPVWLERGHVLVTLLVAAAAAVLLLALVSKDFSLAYVMSHTDRALPWYYAFSAFWAGQEGSLLFWALVVSVMGVIWIASPGYRKMPLEIKQGFWMFFFAFQALFLLILTTVSNPFLQLVPAPDSGSGLNPLLQNLGMIFHPPVLFMGYAGFTVPVCAALASGISEADYAWLRQVRNWVLVAWVFLTAGIVIGAWWSYMELGWGGYWAWDPVENASLLPWLTASAFLHTSLIGRRHRVLGKTNIALLGLTLVMCFFATLLTRSGILQSIHAFGDNEAGMIFLGLILFTLILVFLVAAGSPRTGEREPLGDVFSRQGIIVLLTWLLLALTAVITGATLFPTFAEPLTGASRGLDAGFYNRVCLPLFTAVFLLLALCPGMKWKRPSWDRVLAIAVPGAFLATAFLMWIMGMRQPFPLLAAALVISAFASVAVTGVRQWRQGQGRRGWSVWAIHLGLCLLALGVAVSGPYKLVSEVELSQGQKLQIGEYNLTFQGLEEERTQRFTAWKAKMEVSRGERVLGTLRPERRHYAKSGRPFAEAKVMPGLGDEIYLSLRGVTRENDVHIKAQVMPMVNWLWIGGGLMCLMGLLAVRRQTGPVK